MDESPQPAMDLTSTGPGPAPRGGALARVPPLLSCRPDWPTQGHKVRSTLSPPAVGYLPALTTCQSARCLILPIGNPSPSTRARDRRWAAEDICGPIKLAAARGPQIRRHRPPDSSGLTAPPDRHGAPRN
jgi:hypothetical protein